jgi:TPR repeat protein
MMWTRMWLARIAAMAVFVLGAVSSVQAETRVALVIGNGDYFHANALPNPTNDASDVAASLERLGFSVTRVLNGTYDDLRQAIRSFNVRVEGADIGLIYFAGHGMELAGQNWLIPTDATLKTDLDVANEAISLKTLVQSVSRAGGLGLIILDACRDNPFATKMARSKLTRSVTRGFAKIEPTTNVLVAYAAKDGTTAKDGDRRNSPYTAALLRNLETPGLEISYMFRNIRDEVMTSTHRAQQPFVYGSLSSKATYLKAPPAAAAAPAPSAAPQSVAPPADEAIWLTIKDATDPQVLEEFLSKFAASSHAAEARVRLEGLQFAKECDRLAGADIERDRARTVAVARRADAPRDAAATACDQAMRRFPDVARFAFQAGRAAEARKDFTGARALYEKASAIGSPLAMLRLGLLYSEGNGLPVDDAQARQWYEKAALQNMPSAMARLGMLHELGRGGPQDYAEARRWYEKAAGLGHWPAMIGLGRLYERGLGMPKDAAEARVWYRKAESLKEADKAKPGTAH